MRFSTPSSVLAFTAAAAILSVSPTAAQIGGPQEVPMHPLDLDEQVVTDKVILEAYQDHLDKSFDDHMNKSEMKVAFDQADLNGDGYVDMDEYFAAESKNPPAPVDPEGKNNKDYGRVEVKNNEKTFKEIDLNGNGKIDLKEFKVHISKVINQHREKLHAEIIKEHTEL